MAKSRRRSRRRGYGAGEHRPRVSVGSGTFHLGRHSPYKSHVHRVNPFLREVGMLYGNPHHKKRRRHGYHHNPGGGMTAAVGHVFKHPTATLMDGAIGTLAAYMTISIPNWLLPFPGTDIMSRLLRLVTRVAAGGLIYGIFPRPPVMAGASIGAVGSTLLDFFGTRLIVGAGDQGQTPLALLAPVTGGGAVTAYAQGVLPALASYSRAVLPAAAGVASPPEFPARSVIRHNLY